MIESPSEVWYHMIVGNTKIIRMQQRLKVVNLEEVSLIRIESSTYGVLVFRRGTFFIFLDFISLEIIYSFEV